MRGKELDSAAPSRSPSPQPPKLTLQPGSSSGASRIPPRSVPTIFMEGPYGAPSLHHSRYDTLVLAATGVG